MKSLQELNLSANKFDRLPPAITTLPLTDLYINDNCLQSLPGDIGNMKELRKISFTCNPVEKCFGGILEYNKIDLLKMYMRHNEKNLLDWSTLDLVFRSWLNKVKPEEVPLLLALTSSQLNDYQRTVRSMISHSKCFHKLDANIISFETSQECGTFC
jgi:hypothetical protein